MKLTVKQYLFFKSKYFKLKSKFRIETKKLIKHKNILLNGAILLFIYNNMPLFLYKLILNIHI